MGRALALAAAAAVASCATRPVVVAPEAAPATVCPLEGCDDVRARIIESSAAASACPAAGAAPCSGAPAPECTERALAAWSEAQDDRGVACVARMLTEACSLGDPRACGFSGRLWIDGRGGQRDPGRGIEMLARACDDGIALSCRVAIRWLADPQHAHLVGDDDGRLRARLDMEGDCLGGVEDQCSQIGEGYRLGSQSWPQDFVRSAAFYGRGCDLGQRTSCNNLGDAYEYGSGVGRELPRAAALYERACRLGAPIGCANLGHLIENGEGLARDVARARLLYRDACSAGSAYGCIHAAMSAVESPATPAAAQHALERWERACAARDALACAFVGVVYEDGPDGYARDDKKSTAAMSRGCQMGERRACEYMQAH